MISIYLPLFCFSTAYAFIGPNIVPLNRNLSSKKHNQCKYVHSEAASSFTTESKPSYSGSDELEKNHEDEAELKLDGHILTTLGRSLGAKPAGLLRLQSTTDGVRGVYVNGPVDAGEEILSIPLESCLADDKPPSWLNEEEPNKPGNWVTRLAASLIDLQLRASSEGVHDALALWLSLLPEPEYLQASLPVHWPEETLHNARSTALELAADSSFFARAEAIAELIRSLKASPIVGDSSDDELRSVCNNALDIVQTRSRSFDARSMFYTVEGPIHVLAPIFDFINHGSASCRGTTCANVQVELEGGGSKGENLKVVVRAMRDLKAREEVLIDYGDSARPGWKCLLRYGFVPQYQRNPGPDEFTRDEGDEEEDEAEVYMDGVRYEVGQTSIPVEMVAAVSCMAPLLELGDKLVDEDVEIALTSDVALRIARRISDVAYHLLLEPERDMYDDHPAATPTPFQVISNKLASSLRWSQHRVLLSCALGLREFATNEEAFL